MVGIAKCRLWWLLLLLSLFPPEICAHLLPKVWVVGGVGMTSQDPSHRTFCWGFTGKLWPEQRGPRTGATPVLGETGVFSAAFEVGAYLGGGVCLGVACVRLGWGWAELMGEAEVGGGASGEECP